MTFAQRALVASQCRVALLLGLAIGGCMKPDLVTVRYQVADIDRAASFYHERLGFEPGERFGSMFGAVTRGNLRLILSGPGSSGSRPMPDGKQQAPGGWNRIVLYVDDLSSTITALEKAGARFRNEVEAGPGGKQILIEDPDGNPIELHESPREGAKATSDSRK
jgi:glyoxylase I family protein